jgi:hypothetical protein
VAFLLLPPEEYKLLILINIAIKCIFLLNIFHRCHLAEAREERSAMKLRLLPVASFLLLALSTAAAHAESTASAALTGFSFQLIDLDPNDGIAASLTLSGQNLIVSAAGFPDDSGDSDPWDTLRVPGTASVTMYYGSASSTIGTDGSFATATASNHEAVADSISRWNFSLSAHTTVIFTAVGSASANYEGNMRAFGDAAIFAQYRISPDVGYTNLQDAVFISSGNGGRPLSFSISSSDTELAGIVGNAASAEAYSLTPVPEPESYAMLLAGVAVLACWRWRRKA